MTTTVSHGRSLLFAPGSRLDLMHKAGRSGADALVLDLEDAVAPAAREQARAQIAQVLEMEHTPTGDAAPPAYVRINHPSDEGAAHDIETLCGNRIAGVVLPKARDPADIAWVDRQLSNAEARIGLAAGQLAIIPMIECCRGLHQTHAIASAHPRVRGLALGSAEDGDLMHDMDGQWSDDGMAMAYPRSRMVCDARAAGIDWLIDGVTMNLADNDALRRQCQIARRLGFNGKMVIHPRQLPVVHDVFSPGEQELADAAALLEAFQAAQRAGQAAIRHRGKMVDLANVRRAERLLAVHTRQPH